MTRYINFGPWVDQDYHMRWRSKLKSCRRSSNLTPRQPSRHPTGSERRAWYGAKFQPVQWKSWFNFQSSGFPTLPLFTPHTKKWHFEAPPHTQKWYNWMSTILVWGSGKLHNFIWGFPKYHFLYRGLEKCIFFIYGGKIYMPGSKKMHEGSAFWPFCMRGENFGHFMCGSNFGH